MKKIIALILLFSVCSCSSNKSATNADSTATSTNGTRESTASGSNERDGSTIEKAIIIKARNESDGVSAVYSKLGKMYPGYKMKSQGTSSKGSKHYDIMSIITADNVDKVIYFDITSFYGKF